mmetsp:Transcript_1047/g.1920  ORF Transcript_1047/g.1920 Transcript_1047/m.1920 type:complete len:291 (-) Transcript_1047:44-916(-)|eukprot:CAMPEP_0168614696 /NCGR_PEP_ID=MMETSP0449_2-20121227/4115_1 /TAXON_ID=1082188 /ORGANISM="Strombidium rassoulzadegani, Strain ras09" /LENGTH=290 /DNA_ID=CAMNT_0008655399 /DNA_START=67 /DNA_END=939 /DNA_ORIENTATION=-
MGSAQILDQGKGLAHKAASVVWNYYPLPAEDFAMIMASFAFWSLLYVVAAYSPLPLKPQNAHLKRIDDLDVRNRCISFVHGFGIMLFACYEFYKMPGSCGDANTEFEKRLIYTSVGYFLYDFSALCYYGLVDKTMVIHHWICIVGMSLPLTTNVSANFIVQGMFVAEVSNTFMHVRVILKHYGLRYTKAYETMEICFILLYIYGRILLGPATVWNTTFCPQNHPLVKFCSLGLLAQSVFFVFQMVSILRKRFKEISMRKLNRVKSRWFDPLNKEELEKIGVKNQKEKHIL